jgi:phage shock protein E
MINFGKKLFGAKTDFKTLLEAGAKVIDVRSPEEFREGHFDGAVNIPVGELPTRLADLKSWAKPVITVCRSGARSSVAANILTTAGFRAHNGGAWTDFAQSVKGD